MSDDLPISPSRVIPGSALDVKTSRSGGPGGQHVNKTESKVQLTLDPALVSWIDPGTRLRLVALAGRNVDKEGRIFIVSQEQRDQPRNLETARQKLVELITKALVRPKTRVATKVSKRQKAKRVDEKKARSETKSSRSRIRDY